MVSLSLLWTIGSFSLVSVSLGSPSAGCVIPAVVALPRGGYDGHATVATFPATFPNAGACGQVFGNSGNIGTTGNTDEKNVRSVVWEPIVAWHGLETTAGQVAKMLPGCDDPTEMEWGAGLRSLAEGHSVRAVPASTTLRSLGGSEASFISCGSFSVAVVRSVSDERFALSDRAEIAFGMSRAVAEMNGGGRKKGGNRRRELEPFVRAMVERSRASVTPSTGSNEASVAVGSPSPASVERTKREYPLTLFDLTLDPFGWEEWFLRYHYGPLADFPTYSGNDTGIYALRSGPSRELTADEASRASFASGHAAEFSDGKGESSDDEGRSSDAPRGVRIGVAADWGSGTRESALVSSWLARSGADITMHLGDVYYVGAAQEFRSNVFGIAPEGVEHGVEWFRGPTASFLTAGNHELYDSRAPIYTDGLAWGGLRVQSRYIGQKATYAALVNADWRVIMLDTGYHSYKADQVSPATENHNNTQPDAVIDWLRDTVRLGDPADKRGLVLMFHHQMYSAFSSHYLATPKQLASILPENVVPLVFYGHEHRLSFYDPHATEGLPETFKAYCRCIGNGGYPVSIRNVPSAHPGLTMYDDREMSDELGLDFERHGWNGYTILDLNGPTLVAEYYTLAPDPGGDPKTPGNTTQSLMVRETFAVDASRGGVVSKGTQYVNPGMRRVSQGTF